MDESDARNKKRTSQKTLIQLQHLLFATGVALMSCLPIACAAASGKPNIIFILTDDLGWGDLGVLFQNSRQNANVRSRPWELTPNLDRFAAEGAQLPNHYCAAPVCAPSRASILLGFSQGHANVRDNQFDKALENNHTLATVLDQAGYATVAVGKWGLQGDQPGADSPADLAGVSDQARVRLLFRLRPPRGRARALSQGSPLHGTQKIEAGLGWNQRYHDRNWTNATPPICGRPGPNTGSSNTSARTQRSRSSCIWPTTRRTRAANCPPQAYPKGGGLQRRHAMAGRHPAT